MQDKFILMWAKVNLKKVAVTSAILIKHFSYIFLLLFKRRNSAQHQLDFFAKGYRNNFNIYTTLFLNSSQMLKYKFNLLSRIEYKC